MIQDFSDNKYYRQIVDTDNLPPVPSVFQKIFECINNPKSTAADLQELILQDQAITAKILSLANSAYFGFARQITDVTHAVVMLGFKTVMEVALGVSILSSMRHTHESQFLDTNKFWKYSIACAEASRLVADHLKYKKLEEAYILGLLHDLGKIIFLQTFTDEYDEVLRHCRTEECELKKAEMHTFGFDHQTAGAILADRWNLPKEIIAAIAEHHECKQETDEHFIESSIAYLGEYLVRTAKIGDNGEMRPVLISPGLEDFLTSKKTSSESLINDFEGQQERLEAIFASIM